MVLDASLILESSGIRWTSRALGLPFMIMSFFRKDPNVNLANNIYSQIVEQARNPWFYADCAVPDTPEGRFELLTIHVYLVLQRLKAQGESANALSQKIFDAFFENMDASLREMGVGDLSVGKKIRAMAEAFYGRVGAYETAIAGEDDTSLAEALSRNVFEEENAVGADALAEYLLNAKAAIDQTSLEAIMSGDFTFARLKIEEGI